MQGQLVPKMRRFWPRLFPEDIDHTAIMLDVARSRDSIASLIEAGDLAPDVFVFGDFLDCRNPVGIGSFTIDPVAEDVIDDDTELGNFAGEPVDVLDILDFAFQ